MKDEIELSRIEDAWGRCAQGFRTLQRVGHHGETRVQSLVQLHEQLARRRERFEAGDTLELLHAVALCADENLPLPSWLAVAFLRQFDQFVGMAGNAASLDDAFGSRTLRTETPRSAAKARRDWELGTELWVAVGLIAAQHRGLDPALRAVLKAGREGQRWGIGLTRACELVTRIDSSQTELSSGRIRPLSRNWAKSRK